MKKIDLVYTRLRVEERMILEALRRRDCAVGLHQDSDLVLSLDAQRWPGGDTVLMRSMSLTRSRYLAAILEVKGARVMNSARAIATCGDKILTQLALAAQGVPMPWSFAGFEEEACVAEIEQRGYPVVTKPAVGSWGRMVARVDGRSAAEGLMQMRFETGGASEHVALVQQYIDKPGYDLRVYVMGRRTVGGIRRRSEHWVTNTARGAVPERYEVPESHAKLAERAAAAVGVDIAAVDLLETRDGEVLVNELNHCVEFARSIETTRVPLPELIADHVMAVHP
ncbi:RimK family alpha-L-glutamate ligase [Myxococcus stipitatus]|uniref:RimK family alpha-L-glutamate ligase n=1 Tax=Myxococcus stipitatus TaxID=83455 RepID=UPI001F3F4F35|nr:RimK family alpha-L-glutamate ligase [Myxococcus stipitatus]MCE9672587.1 RimK family alpha-L-glutamate ligase [Myxococcus stipitatus]